ncbi:M48 family metallopeptidase [Caballeronia ptereochthonis]|jgi:Zn-dependent protease with chaperone function|uniref:Peptidase M48 Ste24p n=1 Tax=Caballeronia ptereochthonis TaxID=1777144 RepID=A0A158CVI2_9BURK|nr:M48 family metallopeptidase [Caballeronia ptereochthonis]SAK85577.1 peptidase M48 Ste24p [Caballeronia ptereochthonis]
MTVSYSLRALACALALASFPPLSAHAQDEQRVPAPYTAPNNQIRFGNTALFRNLIPPATLEAQSAEEYAQIIHNAELDKTLLPDSNPLVKRVREIANHEIPFALKWNDRAKNWKWEINVIKSPDARMYCLPGGKIVVYSGLVDKLRLNDNEIGMMIGHEIAHALREHARERLGRQQAAQLGGGAMPQLFGFSNYSAQQPDLGDELLSMRYSPADETEADVIGSEIASRAGYDPRAAVTLWNKIDSGTRRADEGFIWMHPYGPDRKQDLLKRMPDMMPLYAKAVGKTIDQLSNYAGMGRFKKTGR